ncbi:MAG: DUF4915 domain-containing protein [Tumebacillaceae bacterium]
MFTQNRYEVIVTGCKEVGGGIYVITMNLNQYNVVKFLDGVDCRGISRYKDKYIVASGTHGVMVLDQEFTILRKNGITGLDYHDVQLYNDLAYIMETARNAIGIYRIDDLERIGEIKLNPKDHDVIHSNDFYIEGNQLFVSMFTTTGEWRKNGSPYTGAIVEYSLDTGEVVRVLHGGLNKPHNVVFHKGDLYSCNSMEFQVRRNGETIYQCQGFTRGLAMDDHLMFIGQSSSRHIKLSAQGKTNVSMDCGLHVFQYRTGMCRFIPLPSQEIYGVLIHDVEYEQCDRLVFGSEEADGHLVSGFYQIEQNSEETWRWSEGEESKLLLPLKKLTAHRLLLTVAPLQYGDLKQTIEVLVNDQPAGTVELTDQNAKTYELIVPADLVRNRNEVAFRYGYHKKPSEIYGSDDQRDLAVRFVELSFEPLL